MLASGKVFKYGDNIDTDVIIPARYLNISDMDELSCHCMEDIDKNFIKNVKKGDIIVANKNFGCGSSREHAPIVIKESGISCVIASTFARIFYRNAINIGLPILECEEAATNIESGDKIEIDYAPKGFGSENMSKSKMLKPSDGIEGVKKFILDTVSEAGPNPCPPIVVGVGIGGTLDKCAQIAKKALFRNVGEHSEDEFIADLEKEMLVKINNLGIGPQGLGGNTTALAINIETFPTHIAGLPVVVNINCHAARHKSVII